MFQVIQSSSTSPPLIAQGGTAVFNDNGTSDPSDDFLIYTPPTGFTGADSFDYLLSDGMGGFDVGRAFITVS